MAATAPRYSQFHEYLANQRALDCGCESTQHRIHVIPRSSKFIIFTPIILCGITASILHFEQTIDSMHKGSASIHEWQWLLNFDDRGCSAVSIRSHNRVPVGWRGTRGVDWNVELSPPLAVQVVIGMD